MMSLLSEGSALSATGLATGGALCPQFTFRLEGTMVASTNAKPFGPSHSRLFF